MADLNPQTIKVFLPQEEVLADDLGHLSEVLRRAGMEVVRLPGAEGQEGETLEAIEEALAAADCTVHLLGNHYGRLLEGTSRSVAEHAFEKARELAQDPERFFRVFIWHPESWSRRESEPRQQDFLNRVRNNIARNMVFSNNEITIQFVEELRGMMADEKKAVYETQTADIFFIHNEMDAEEASVILNLISDVARVSPLSIILDSDMDYSEYVSQQMARSQVTAIYFRKAAFWAIPFAQQVWKSNGGASATSKMVLLADALVEGNEGQEPEIPGVDWVCAPNELLPIELKVKLDERLNP